jgi:hypothetical protein
MSPVILVALTAHHIPTLQSNKSTLYMDLCLSADQLADILGIHMTKAWKALHFTMQILKKGNSNTKSLAYMSLVCPILEYGAACGYLYREGQINALDRVQEKAAKFAHHKNSPNWETLASHRNPLQSVLWGTRVEAYW